MSSNPNHYLFENLNLDDLFRFVDSRYKIKKSGYKLNFEDSRVFYKMRHNVFKTMVSYFLGIPNEMEKSFLELGLCDSNRTPDFISVNEENILIIEYTVSNKMKTTIVNKESFGKYDPEIFTLREKYSKEIIDYYLCLSLDEDVSELFFNIKNLSKYINDTYLDDLYSSISNLKDEFIYLNWYINEKMPELLSNQEFSSYLDFKIEPIDISPPFITVHEEIKSKRLKNIFIKKKIKKHLRTLSKSFSRKANNLLYKLVYNFNSDTLYTQFDESGVKKSVLMNLIQTEDDSIYDICEIRDAYLDLDEPFKKFGETEHEFDFTDRLKETYSYIDDQGYSSHLCNRLKRINVKTLIDCDLEKDSLKVELLYMETLLEKNKSSSNVTKMKKNPFIFPVTIGLSKKIEKITFHSKFLLTNAILKKAVDIKNISSGFINRNIDYDTIVSLEEKSSLIWNKIKSIPNIRKLMRSKNLKDDILNPETLNDILEYKKIRTQFSTSLGEDTRTQYSNRISFPLSFIRSNFPLEMEHYSRENNKIYVYPDNDFDEVLESYRRLILEIFQEKN